jgi:hypothetical protein
MRGPPGAGWSSLAARRAHNPKVAGSNPAPATINPLSIPIEDRFSAEPHLDIGIEARPHYHLTPVIDPKLPMLNGSYRETHGVIDALPKRRRDFRDPPLDEMFSVIMPPCAQERRTARDERSLG